MSRFRIFISIAIGLVIAIALIAAFEGIGGSIFQHPALDPKNPDTISDMMKSMPVAAFLWLLLGYAVSSFAGGLVASLISSRVNARPSLIVGSILTVGGIMNLIMIPYHPVWFMIADVLIYVPFAWFGFLAVRKKENQL